MCASSDSRSVHGLRRRSARFLLSHDDDGGGRCGNRGAISKDRWARVRASMGPGVPGMFDSLEVQVLCPGLVETKG